MSHVKTNGAWGVYTPTSVFSLNFWGLEKEGIAVFVKTNCLPSPKQLNLPSFASKSGESTF